MWPDSAVDTTHECSNFGCVCVRVCECVWERGGHRSNLLSPDWEAPFSYQFDMINDCTFNLRIIILTMRFHPVIQKPKMKPILGHSLHLRGSSWSWKLSSLPKSSPHSPSGGHDPIRGLSLQIFPSLDAVRTTPGMPWSEIRLSGRWRPGFSEGGITERITSMVLLLLSHLVMTPSTTAWKIFHCPPN